MITIDLTPEECRLAASAAQLYAQFLHAQIEDGRYYEAELPVARARVQEAEELSAKFALAVAQPG